MPIVQGFERFSDAKFKRSESNYSLGLNWRLPAVVVKAMSLADKDAQTPDMEAQLS